MIVPARIYNRVLVPLDGSSAAEFAIRFASDLASKHDAELILLYLDYLPVPVGEAEHVEDGGRSREQIEAYLDGLRKGLRAAGIRTHVEHTSTRDLAGTLYKMIEAERVSAVVISTQGRAAMMRWLFGTGVERALNEFPVPLLLVRPMYQRIVVPLDGSRWSESAIPRASELARVHDAELVLLHIYQPKGSDYADQWALAGHQQIAEQSLGQMQEQLIAMRNRLRAEGLRAREVIIRGSNPAQAICDFVETEDGISMVVMSTHGRTGLARWLVGSVAQQVIKHARCPVTLVYPDQ
ncbi:MAG: universal stress protein [Anaerolineae bacterium]|nr:universal stress protein [Anaerolineae bacterium]